MENKPGDGTSFKLTLDESWFKREEAIGDLFYGDKSYRDNIQTQFTIPKKKFYIQLGTVNWVKKGSIISSGSNNLKVVRVYRNSKFKRFLNKLGFKLRFDCIKVKLIDN